MNRFGTVVLAIGLLVGAFSVGCSSENTDTQNANQAVSTGASTNHNTQAPSNGTPSAGPSQAVSPAPQPASTPQPPASQSPSPSPQSQPTTTPVAGSIDVPKLVLSTTKINFGKQPKERTIARSITVRNAGKAELRISAVEPG
jgi:hypothetical protein